ncbi:MAG TPA: LuxR C-terminal-related transcriptional regulator [Streptosporangiaceae bacterium]
MRTATRPRGAARPFRSDPLLADRTRVPRPRFPLLARPRLDAAFAAAVRRRVTLVHALAGSGKTTACASWAARVGDCDVAWLTADASDDAERVRTGVRAALAGVDAGWAAALRGAAVPGAREPGEPDAVGDRALAAAVARAERPVVLVVDEADALSAASLAPLDHLIAHAPPRLRLILLARRRPRLRLARLHVAGDLSELTTADLACDASEAAAYLELTGASGTGPAGLMAATDGWMAAMRLYVDDGAASGVLLAYVDEEVLDVRPGARALLAELSVADRLTGDLAVALTGRADAPALLRELADDGLLHAGEGRSRCRAPVAAALAARGADALASDRRTELLRTAAEWYAAHGDGTEAVRAAARTGDPGRTEHVLLDTGLTIAMAHGPAHLESLLAELPVDPDAAGIVRATARLFAGDTAGARHHLAAVRDDARTPLLQAKHATMELAVRLSEGRPPDATVAETVTEGGVEPAVVRAWGEYAFFTGLRWAWLGESRAAAAAFADAAGAAGDAGGLADRARAWGALVLAWRRDLGAAERMIAAVGGAPWPLALARAWVCLERDDPRAAEEAVRDLDGTAAALPGEPCASGLAGVVWARAAIALGDLDRARAALEEIAGAELGPYGASLRAGALVELAQRSGDMPRARELARTLTGGVSGPPSAPAALLLGRVLLQADEPRAALDAVAAIITEAEPAPAEPVVVEARGSGGRGAAVHERGRAGAAAEGPYVGAGERAGALAIAAAAYGRLRAGEDAARLLGEALGLVEAEAAYGVLIACGAPLRALVTMVKPADAGRDRVRRELLRRFDLRPAAGERRGAAAHATVGDEPLTRAELAVLRFLPSHMTNTEIAESLVVSVNTVKTHLRAVYRKLGVTTRRDAIRAADALGLL